MTGNTDFADVRKCLTEHGLKPTHNRVLVLEVIMQSGMALTAREVYASVSLRHALNRVTVYRILDRLSEFGVVNRSTCGDRVHHFCMGGAHSHFHCSGCGEVTCVDNKKLNFDADKVGNALPASVKHVDLLLEGICEQCSAHGCQKSGERQA